MHGYITGSVDISCHQVCVIILCIACSKGESVVQSPFLEAFSSPSLDKMLLAWFIPPYPGELRFVATHAAFSLALPGLKSLLKAAFFALWYAASLTLLRFEVLHSSSDFFFWRCPALAFGLALGLHFALKLWASLSPLPLLMQQQVFSLVLSESPQVQPRQPPTDPALRNPSPAPQVVGVEQTWLQPVSSSQVSKKRHRFQLDPEDVLAPRGQI